MKRGCVADMAPLEPARRAIPPTGTKRLVQDTNSVAIYNNYVQANAKKLIHGQFRTRNSLFYCKFKRYTCLKIEFRLIFARLIVSL